MGIIISFINLKGGVGKTTCCFNIAGTLSKTFNKKVLAIDLDAQANLSELMLNKVRYSNLMTQINNNEKQDVYHIFNDAINGTTEFNFDQNINKSVIKYKGNEILPNLDLLPASYHLQKLEREIIHYERTKSRILSSSLNKIKDDYDYILLDCPPNIYTATLNALYASDVFYIPTIPDMISITGIPYLTNQLKKIIEIKLEEENKVPIFGGIIVNLFDTRIKAQNESLDEISIILNDLIDNNIVDSNAIVFDEKIRNTADIKKSLDKFVPICIFDSRSPSTAEFQELTKAIIDQIDKFGF